MAVCAKHSLSYGQYRIGYEIDAAVPTSAVEILVINDQLSVAGPAIVRNPIIARDQM